MEITVFGPGCAKCHQTEKIVQEAVAESGVNANVHYVTDLAEIAKQGVFSTPTVMIDGQVKSVGKVPKKDEVKGWLGQ